MVKNNLPPNAFSILNFRNWLLSLLRVIEIVSEMDCKNNFKYFDWFVLSLESNADCIAEKKTGKAMGIYRISNIS